jgi:hypothetical protein
MRTITIDIINEKAINLLRDLELLKLIRLRREESAEKPVFKDWTKYKGAITKQPLDETNQQLNDLRRGWE